MRRLRSLGLAMALATAAWCLPAAPALAQPVADEVQRLLSAGRGEEALLRAEQALAMAPDDARTQFVLAVVLLELGRDAQALPLFQQLAQQFPELPDPLNNILAFAALPRLGAEGAPGHQRWATSCRARRRQGAEDGRQLPAVRAAGHYDGTIFHRVIDGFMIQGGGYAPT
jgi:tetratricopeptide (TPR) repeat protein